MDYLKEPHSKIGKYYKKYNRPDTKKIIKRYNERKVEMDFISYCKTQITSGCNYEKKEFYESRYFNDLIKIKMTEFIDINKDEIIKLYKGTLVAFNIHDKPFLGSIEIYLTKQLNLIISFYPEKEEIISCCTIAKFKNNDFNKITDNDSSNINREEYKKLLNIFHECHETENYQALKPTDSEIGHFCDGQENCKNDISKGSLICEICDFDLCTECRNNIHHEHKMFEYNGYYGWDTLDTKDIIDKVIVTY